MVRLKFIQDDTAEGVEIVIRAKEQNQEVRRVLRMLQGETDKSVVCQTITDKEKIDINEIVFIAKDGRFLSVKTENEEFVIAEPLYKFEEKLDPDRFVRISQSQIVNLDHVKKWNFEGGGIIMVEMTNGIKSYTSRRYATEIRKILKKGGNKQWRK